MLLWLCLAQAVLAWHVATAQDAATHKAGPRTYYVSPFGDDTDLGSREHPWRTLQHAAEMVGAGDTVLARGGVYRQVGVHDPNRGRITVRMLASGTPHARITFRAFPGETPILEGRDPLTAMRPCASESSCGSNSHWRNIRVADLPAGYTMLGTALFHGDRFMHAAQDPNPPTAFYENVPSTWRQVPQAGYTTSRIVDPAYLNQADPLYWVGAYVRLWSGNNNIFGPQRITAYDPRTGTIEFEPFYHSDVRKPGTDRYAVMHRLDLLDHEGEYHVEEDKQKVYYWPYSDLSPSDVMLAARDKAFDVHGQDYITIQGFTIVGYRGAAITNYSFGAGADAFGVEVKDNIIHTGAGDAVSLYKLSDSIVENNVIHDVAGVGVHFGGGGNNRILRNQLRRVGKTGLRMYGVVKGSIVGNTNEDSRGQHANGITAYLGCDGILIAGNSIVNSNISLTFQSSVNLTVMQNLFSNPGGMAIGGWSGKFKGRAPNNIIIRNNAVNGRVYVSESFEGVVVDSDSNATRDESALAALDDTDLAIFAAETFAGTRRALDVRLDATLELERAGDAAESLSLAWDLGDGTAERGPVVGHAYQQGGRYLVRLTVSDGGGVTRRGVKHVSVHAPKVLDLEIADGDLRRAAATDGRLRLVETEQGEAFLSLGRDPLFFGMSEFGLEVTFRMDRVRAAAHRGERQALVWNHARYGIEHRGGELVFHLWTGANGDAVLRSGPKPLFDEQWHTAKLVYTAASGEIAAFLDGRLVDRESGLEGAVGGPMTWDLLVGGTGSGGTFGGDIERVRLVTDVTELR